MGARAGTGGSGSRLISLVEALAGALGHADRVTPRKGNCWDNAPMQSFFGNLKTELDGDGPFDTRQAARTALFRAIEGWHNRERLHSSLGYTTPANKEQLAAAA